jgi:hypothetical protein
MNSPQRLLLFLPLFALLTGCATESALRVPVRPAPYHELKPLPPAVLNVPVIIHLPPLSEVEKQMADDVKKDLAKVGDSLTKSLGTTLWADPLAWDFKGNSLTVHVNVHYQKIQPTPGATPTDENAEKKTQVDLSPTFQWNKDWYLESPELKQSASASGSTTETNEDVTRQKAEDLVRSGSGKYSEDLKKGSSIQDKIKDLWDKVQEPIELGKDVWLQIRTDKVSIGTYKLIPDPKSPEIQTVFEIYAQPNVIFGPRPKAYKNPLPPLTNYEPGLQRFRIESNFKISFADVNKILTDPKTGILNKTLPGSGDHHLKITQLHIYGSGGQLVVEAQVAYDPVMNLSSQQAKLTIYLLGTPHYHEDTQTIDFPDLDFDIQTSDFLVQMAEFVAGSGLTDELRKVLVIPVGKNLDEVKAKMDKAMNRPIGKYAVLHTTIDSLSMEEVFVSDFGLEGRVAMDGDISAELKL